MYLLPLLLVFHRIVQTFIDHWPHYRGWIFHERGMQDNFLIQVVKTIILISHLSSNFIWHPSIPAPSILSEPPTLPTPTPTPRSIHGSIYFPWMSHLKHIHYKKNLTHFLKLPICVHRQLFVDIVHHFTEFEMFFMQCITDFYSKSFMI